MILNFPGETVLIWNIKYTILSKYVYNTNRITHNYVHLKAKYYFKHNQSCKIKKYNKKIIFIKLYIVVILLLYIPTITFCFNLARENPFIYIFIIVYCILSIFSFLAQQNFFGMPLTCSFIYAHNEKYTIKFSFYKNDAIPY